MMEIEQLWREIDQRVAPRASWGAGLDAASDGVLAGDVRATIDQPPFDQSAVDGFAFPTSDRERHRIVGTVVAGAGSAPRLEAGGAVRVLTGGIVPAGAFAVVKQEDCRVVADSVRAEIAFAAGENIRVRGGIFRSGDVLLRAGTALRPGSIGLLASAGIGTVAITRVPQGLHIVTGDEVVPPGAELRPGQIPDANGPMIGALLQAARTPMPRKYLPDSADALERDAASFSGDLLLISGGSGAGARDHTLHALQQAGFDIHCNRLNSRPGRPLIFATRGCQAAIGLPGNPLSHWVCFHVVVRRILDRMAGRACAGFLQARLTAPLGEVAGRTWIPAALTDRDGRPEATPLPWIHSGDLTPLARANALILQDGESREAMPCFPC